MKHEFKIDYIEAVVTDKDVLKGIAGQKVTAQVETKLTEWGEQGWDYYRSEVIRIEVLQTNCFGGKTGKAHSLNLLMFVFRREIR
jgi:hypothetical protein